MLLRIRKNKQITLPARLCKLSHLEDGDFLQAQVNGDGIIMLTPKKLIDKSQAWFWTESWQAGEREAQEQIDRGEVVEFESVEDFLRDLHEGDQ